MRKIIYIPASILIAIPLLTIFYKIYFAGLSFLPVSLDYIWNIEILISPKQESKYIQLNFPILKSTDDLEVIQSNFDNRSLNLDLEKKSYGNLAKWESENDEGETYDVLQQKPIVYNAKIKLINVDYPIIEKDSSRKYTPKINKYLELNQYSKKELLEANKLIKALSIEDKDKTEKAKYIYYFIHEEILNTLKTLSLEESMLLRKGSSYNKSKLYTLLCRLSGVPTRTIMGIYLDQNQNSEEEDKFKIQYWNEVYLNNRWFPVLTMNEYFGTKPSHYVSLYRNADRISSSFEDSNSNFNYRIYAKQVQANSYNLKEYAKEVKESGTFINLISLYGLPINQQSLYRMILLLPLGGLILSVFRNIIGVPTFGIFTPILLTLFFFESGLAFGLVFFTLIVAFGFFERYILDKLYLLAVPRMSIILTLTVFSLVLFSTFTNSFQLLSGIGINLFPIVITTVFIERFSVMLIEEGSLNTIIAVSGTLFVSITTYLLFLIPNLSIIFFTHPELLLMIVGFLLILGDYKGYRISELIRFKDLVKVKGL
ncbi:MAG: UUP1 family membrane protein [Leptospiraceae bacterium]|nr:UUP1 family membrane protein [Leptospiraceae bacterium]